MSVQTLQSGDYGNHWNVTYSSTSTRGMVLDPQVVSSPAGYFYLTWRDSGAGPWEVDYAVLSTSGSAVLNRQPFRELVGPSVPMPEPVRGR